MTLAYEKGLPSISLRKRKKALCQSDVAWLLLVSNTKSAGNENGNASFWNCQAGLCGSKAFWNLEDAGNI